MPRLLPIVLCLLLPLDAACNASGVSKEDRARQIEIHIDSARAYINMGEFERAEHQALRGLSLEEDNQELLLALARARQMQGTTAKVLSAESIYRELPRQEDYKVALGFAETLERKGLAFEEAAAAVRSGERPVAGDPEERARELERTARESWRESVELFREGLDLRAGNTELMNGLARVHALLGNDDEALRWCTATIELLDGDRGFWKRQLDRESLTVDEEQRFRAALARLDELEVGIRLLAANLEVRLENPGSAVDHLGRVIALRPTMPQAYTLRAGLLMQLGRYEQVVADVDDFLRRTTLPFEDPTVQRALDLKEQAGNMLRAQLDDVTEDA